MKLQINNEKLTKNTIPISNIPTYCGNIHIKYIYNILLKCKAIFIIVYLLILLIIIIDISIKFNLNLNMWLKSRTAYIFFVSNISKPKL